MTDNSLRNSILASVIASFFFLIFIQPLIRFLWDIIIFVSKYVYQGYVNSIYLSAALGPRNDVVVIFLFLMTGFMLAVILYPAIFYYFRHKTPY